VRATNTSKIGKFSVQNAGHAADFLFDSEYLAGRKLSTPRIRSQSLCSFVLSRRLSVQPLCGQGLSQDAMRENLLLCLGGFIFEQGFEFRGRDVHIPIAASLDFGKAYGSLYSSS